ncbi:hypothetical protein JVU11DRAFT_10081 [Chiua virens]|nr:hypothetical protein JVU11DRAFT_10081 [Chiua virens]
MSNDHSADILAVSTIDISLARDSERTVESIQLGTDSEGSLKDIQTTLRAGDTYQEKFDPPLVVQSDDHIFISAGSSPRSRKRFEVVVDIDLQDAECMREDQGIKSYRKKTRHVEVVVGCCPPGKLVPVTDELIRMCGKFRVLVIGNSGVGKSTLIRRMFGVENIVSVEDVVSDSSTESHIASTFKHTSEIVHDTLDIDQEFTSQTNERFVVHDSLGFEAGDERNMGVVKDFVKRRQAMPRLEDQLHAIWLCVEIPHSGGRLAEGGVERFLQHQHEIIGDIPLIVVLTKMDLLDIRLDLDAQGQELLESRRSRHLEKHCIAPLCKAAGRDVICVAVCAKEGYLVTLANLMKATNENMARHAIHEAPRAMASIAQRVDMKAKIEISIAVGGKEYWRNLLESTFFHGRTLEKCLDVIRKDIVTIWNLIVLDHCLMDEQLMLALVPADVLGGAGTSQPTMRDLLRRMADEGFLLAVKDKFPSVVTDALRMPYDKYQETCVTLSWLGSN